ncbi:UNVERIFIED_CONTAM: hypothetical protein PYX00_004204 [Menopon gallinae]|uniref:PPM-type phosphatase domain-containing protein n=1 Tax=Menopon gallinae TaxID=328185 RepID=A0AAW2I2R7_9NEOP
MYNECITFQEAHPYEDFSCHVRVDREKGDSTFLYGIFDGQEGPQAASFALQRMAAEILLYSQLSASSTDEEIREILRQAFIAVESDYWDSVGDKLAERTSVQCEIPDGLTSYEAYQKYPHLVDKLNALNTELSCGTTAVIALIHNNKLYVANVGDSRALLCKTDTNGVLRVVQLSIDHDLRNEDELLRLYKLGLNTEEIRKRPRLGNQENTRCIGNYLVKGGYKDFEELAGATAEPVIAEPEVHGGIVLDETCSFLLLMSKGLFKSLQEATRNADTVNKEIAQMTVEQFRVQSTLTGVAQGVVDKIVRIHHDVYMSGASDVLRGERDDITLLVRNFNFPMPNALESPTNPQVRFNPVVSMAPVATYEESITENESDIVTNDDTKSTQDTTTTSNTDSSDGSDMYSGNVTDERIQAYVDFSEFQRNYEKGLQKGTLPPSLRPR